VQTDPDLFPPSAEKRRRLRRRLGGALSAAAVGAGQQPLQQPRWALACEQPEGHGGNVSQDRRRQLHRCPAQPTPAPTPAEGSCARCRRERGAAFPCALDAR
jgi:hypothetical protein